MSAEQKIGKVAYVPYAKPGSAELVNSANKALAESDESVKTIIMERHGIIVYDIGMEKCYERTELVEESAKVGIYSSLTKAALAQLEK